MNWKFNVVKIVLTIIIIVLVYLIYDSIMRPVRFNQATHERERVVISRLIDLRLSQQFYKRQYNKFTDNLDTLITFLKVGEIPVVSLIPDPTDTTFTRSISDTLEFVKVADSLFSRKINFSVDSLRFIPFSGNKLFEIEAGNIERGGINVPVFEIRAHYHTFLAGLDRQLIVNLVKSKEDIERYPGLKVGSMQEPSTDGNWE
ncbi:MAG: hypothetical protein K0B08_11405 [Bacteroidales bacterium]|nr:hypothetical protein [Bacteroidales bacterium]